MPLARSDAHAPIHDVAIHSSRFPMTTGAEMVHGEISHGALIERAARDGLPVNIAKSQLFDEYREELERIASKLFDEGRAVRKDRVLIVRIPNGRF